MVLCWAKHCCDQFLKYSGLFLTTRMTFSNAADEMVNKARKGLADILRMLWRLGDFLATIFLIVKMFDAKIKQMLLMFYTVQKCGG